MTANYSPYPADEPAPSARAAPRPLPARRVSGFLVFAVAAAAVAPTRSFSPTASPSGPRRQIRTQMYPAGGVAVPSETALRSASLNWQGTSASPWQAPPPVGLLHPDTMNLLVGFHGRPAFEANPAMAAFLDDYEANGPMGCMHHLSDPHVTARLVSMTSELNKN